MLVDPNSIAGNHFEETPSAPRFDARAAASAQPVEPIQRHGELVHHQTIQGWMRKVSLLLNQLGGQSRALAIVVLFGLITGALGGLLLVNAARPGVQPAITETAINDSSRDAKRSETQKLGAFATGPGGAALEMPLSRTRNRKGRGGVADAPTSRL